MVAGCRGGERRGKGGGTVRQSTGSHLRSIGSEMSSLRVSKDQSSNTYQLNRLIKSSSIHSVRCWEWPHCSNTSLKKKEVWELEMVFFKNEKGQAENCFLQCEVKVDLITGLPGQKTQLHSAQSSLQPPAGSLRLNAAQWSGEPFVLMWNNKNDKPGVQNKCLCLHWISPVTELLQFLPCVLIIYNIPGLFRAIIPKVWVPIHGWVTRDFLYFL